MLNSDDFTQMQNDLLAVRDDRAASLILRRSSTTLSAQSVRIARQGRRGMRSENLGGAESRVDVIVLGAVGLDVEVGDRFTDGGILYEVMFIRPNRAAATMVECKAVE